LGYEQNRARWSGESEPGSFRTAYALVEEGRDGFAVINQVMPQPPKSGDYVKVGRVYRDWQTNSVVHFSLPFDRYYMEETKAPKAEHAYREHLNRRGQTNDNTYAVVRIKSGEAVLEDVYVDGKPIAEFIRGAKP
jgi:ketosteroid isomerase-like protein